MDTKSNKVLFYISTALLSLLILYSVSMYFLFNEQVAETFQNLGFPVYLIYPLAIAKIIGLFLIWTRISNTLKEWAYCGFFFNFVLALTAHIVAQDGQFSGALIALILLIASYLSQRKAYKSN